MTQTGTLPEEFRQFPLECSAESINEFHAMIHNSAAKNSIAVKKV